MTPKTTLAALLAALALAAPGEPAATNAPTGGVDAIMQSLRKSFSSVRTVQARFVQEKTLKAFDRTIVLKGRLSVEKPDRLAWRVDVPIRYALVLDGKYAWQWDEETNKVQKRKTAGDPIFEEVLGQIEKWFSGRFAELTTSYDVALLSSDPLKLSFVPKKDELTGKAIRRVVVAIRADRKYVDSIEIEDVSGDRTLIRFLDVRLNRPVPANEWNVDPDEAGS